MFKKIKIIVLLFSFVTFFIISTSVSSLAFGPSSSTIYQGIDVSSWQGNINFAQVKNAGIDIVYIKSSEGVSYIDPYFERNYQNAKANGLKVGFYHYVTARTVEEARNQANFFAKEFVLASDSAQAAITELEEILTSLLKLIAF